MYVFFNSMAFFWALAEVWILLVLIQGVASATGRAAKPVLYRTIFTLSAISLAIIAFGGTTIASQFAVMKSPLFFHFYRCAQWHFFCTFWVVLEGVIMVYIFRIYMMIKHALIRNGPKRISPQRLTVSARMAVAVLVSCALLFLMLYEYQTVDLIKTARFQYHQINMLSFFYMKICGIFWVVFDGGVAVLGYKTYALLKSHKAGRGETFHGDASAVG